MPPKGAPNTLLIMTHDDGFGAPGTFGGVIPTPALERIAKNGLRYTNFHSTSLCSPTRVAIITGRNHHSVAFGVVGEIATGFPGYDSIIPIEKGTIGTILKDNGYGTAWFGKDHNTPFFEDSQAGPFNQWPTGMGFDYFYGFVGGDTSQWEPNLFRNTTAIYPFQGNPGWSLTTAMADEAIHYMKQLKELAPEKPFFVYYVPGGTHAPHHPTKEWIDKISAMDVNFPFSYLSGTIVREIPAWNERFCSIFWHPALKNTPETRRAIFKASADITNTKKVRRLAAVLLPLPSSDFYPISAFPRQYRGK